MKYLLIFLILISLVTASDLSNEFLSEKESISQNELKTTPENSIILSDDIKLNIDKDLNNLELKPDENIKTDIELKKGVLIKKIRVKSDNKLYESLLNNYLQQKFTRTTNQEKLQKDIRIPKNIPQGEANLEIEVEYEDKDLKTKTITKKQRVKVKGNKFLGIVSKILPEDSALIIANKIKPVEIPRIKKELIIDDLQKKDLDLLGITTDDFLKGLELKQKAEELKNQGQDASSLIAESKNYLPDIKEIAKKEKTLSFEETKDKLKEYEIKKAKLNPDVEISTKTFKLSKNDKSIVKSKVTLSIPASADLLNLELLVYIPKEIAKSTDLIYFSETPLIIQKDPVIKWAFKNVPQNQIKDYSYTVDGDIQNFETLAVSSADSPGLLTKIIAYMISLVK